MASHNMIQSVYPGLGINEYRQINIGTFEWFSCKSDNILIYVTMNLITRDNVVVPSQCYMHVPWCARIK